MEEKWESLACRGRDDEADVEKPKKMKLYATTRWVGAYYELSSLLPYRGVFNVLKEEGEWQLDFPSTLWEVLEEMCHCLEPVEWAMKLLQSVFFSFSFHFIF